MADKSGGGQARSQKHSSEEEVEEAPPTDPEAAEHQQKLTEDVESMLDEIDDVLEENAEEFVRGYVQKGGQ